ncbi:MAG: Kelch repeat-containing protein [Acidimicrobiales bacterium]
MLPTPARPSTFGRGIRGWAVVLSGVLTAAGCAGPAPSQPGPGPGPGVIDPGRGLPSSVAETPLPVPRTEVAGAVLDGRLVVVGGLDERGQASDLVHSYDPGSAAWTPLPPLPTARHHVGLAAAGGRLWLAGGYEGGAGDRWVAKADVWSLGGAEPAWRSEPAMGTARGGLGLAALGDVLVALGGTPPGGPASTTTETLTIGSGRWKPGPPMTQARDHLGAATLGDRVYAVAGRTDSLESNVPTVESWAPGEASWRAEAALTRARSGIAVVGGNRLCVAGGETPSGTVAEVECLGLRGWFVAASLTVPRHGLAAGRLEGGIHVVGGGPQPGLTVEGAHEVLAL